MIWWEGVVLGLVQGLTEFLPISSSGHLVVAEAALGLTVPGVTFEVVLHLATLLAVFVVYRKRIWSLLRGAGRADGAALRYLGLLLVATVPAAVVGLVLKPLFERAFDSLLIVGIDLMVTGVVLWSTRRVLVPTARSQPSLPGAAAIGLAQALAILPGISRAGSTVAAGLWLGLRPAQAAEFSFLMAVPAIAGAALLEIPHLASAGVASAGVLGLSFAVALVAGVLAIKVLVRLLERGAFHRFAPYCWALGLGTCFWALRP